MEMACKPRRGEARFKPMKIINKTKNTILADQAYAADTLFARLKGLLGKRELKKGQALILRPCNSIHTFFMRFAIDVIFLDSENRIILIQPRLLPWRLSPICWRGKFAVELPSGVIEESRTTPGDQLTLS